MPKNVNKKSPTFSKAKTVMLTVFAVTALLIAAFPKLYEIKSKAGINISQSRHAPTYFQKKTHGLFKCEWLYPYKSCDGQ